MPEHRIRPHFSYIDVQCLAELRQRQNRILGKSTKRKVGPRTHNALVPIDWSSLVERAKIGCAEDPVSQLLDTAIHAISSNPPIVSKRVFNSLKQKRLRRSNTDLQLSFVQIAVYSGDFFGRHIDERNYEFGSILSWFDLPVNFRCKSRGSD